MSKKMIFFDIDGTLLDHDKKIPKSTKEAVNALKEAGHEVAIATGRAPFMFKDVRDELGIESFVSFNGQYVELQGEVIYKNPIKEDSLHLLSNVSSTKKHPLIYMNHEEMKATTDYHHHIVESMSSLKFNHPDSDPDFFKDRDIYQTLLFCTNVDEPSYRESFKDLDFIRWHEYSMDVLPLGGSKAGGIEKFIEKLGFKNEDVYAFGDNLNDIEMLKFVENSVAMGNAPDLVKKAAKYVTKDVSEDGIAYGLERVGLLK